MAAALHRVVAVCLLLVLAGCSGGPAATGTATDGAGTQQPQSASPATGTPAPTVSPSPTATPFPRGGLLTVSPTNSTAEQAVEYDAAEFGEVPALNRTVVEAARTNGSATEDLSAAELDAVDAFVDAHPNATAGSFPVRVGDTTVEVSVAREA